MSRVIVVGLGPADDGFVPAQVSQLVDEHPAWLRTRRHPAAAAFGHLPSFDEFYDAADDLAEVYSRIVDELAARANSAGTVVYLVPGSPLVAEYTVELLRDRTDVRVEVQPAVSFLDLAWDRLGIDPMAVGVQLVDGHRFEELVAGLSGPILVGQCDHQFVLSDIKLALDAAELPAVTVLQRLGLPDEHVETVEWAELDRAVEPDHLTSIFVPWLPDRPASAIERLHAVVARLRADCPWDREQTHASLAKHAVEEADEVREAIEALDVDDPSADQVDDLVHELGDLLFQVMLHAALGEESGDFTFIDVVEAIRNKMIRRHPHVFDRDPDLPPITMAELAGQWESIKAAERAARGR